MTKTQVKTNPSHELSDAILDNDLERVQKAIQKGAEVNATSVSTDTSLLTIKSLWEMSPLIKALKNNVDTEIVDTLVKAGATYDIPNIFNCTGLYFASVDGNTPLVEKLLNLNANPNITNSFGETPLHMAVLCGHVDCVKALCQSKDIDLTIRDNHNRTALDCCNNLPVRRSCCTRIISQYAIDEIKTALCQKMNIHSEPKAIAHKEVLQLNSKTKELQNF